MQDKQAAKKIIKISKRNPHLNSKADVRYAKMIKRRIKLQQNGQRYSENKSE